MGIDTPLVRLGQWLLEQRYRFVTATPATHARVNARPDAGEARCVEDVFGWSRPFRAGLLPPAVVALLDEAGALRQQGDRWSSAVRFATLDDRLYVHSAYPTTSPDAVFFGPDTYRFAALIKRTLHTRRTHVAGCIVDVGCGAGAGGLVALDAADQPAPLVLTDINPAALRFAAVNAALAGVAASFREGDLFSTVDEPVALVVANPPYLVDPDARVYRHGGGALGSALSLRILREGVALLAPGGTLILYTGSPIVQGRDLLREAVDAELADSQVAYRYDELDPDVFGEELEMPAYATTDRIAVVGIVVRTKP